MKTLIELYDSNLILNICTAIYLKPENVVFVCGKAKSEKNRNIMTEMLSRHCPDTQVHFYKADSSDTSDIIECLEEITERFPDCAIEINGGNNTEIFAAGVFTAAQKLPVFSYNPRTGKAVFVDGYIELPGRNSFPKLSIDDFAHMAGGKYSSHGHFDIEKLKPETMIVADR